MPAKRAIITGGAGYIGAHVANELARRGFDTLALDIDNNAHGWLDPAVPLAQVDVRDRDALARASMGASCIFHLAALPRVQYSIDFPRESHDTNVNGTLNVLLAARDAGARVVFSSSSAVYGDPETLPLTEDMPARPKSPYALHKYIGERYLALFREVHGIEAVALRYFNVYGPDGDPDGPYALVIPKFLAMRQAGKPLTITGDGEQTRDYVHIRDVVRANLLAAESDAVGRGEVINIGSGVRVSVNRIAALIGGPVEYVPARLEPRDTLADISRARSLLGFEPEVSFEEGMAEVIGALAGADSSRPAGRAIVR